MSAPCGWDLDTQGVPGWVDADPAQQAAATAFATHVLWALSGRQYGVCVVTVRPVVAVAQACLSGGLYAVSLPGPVVSVEAVTIDGVVVDPVDYRLVGSDLLRSSPWPVVNDLALEDTEPGTWSVTYSRGIPVPEAGQFAAGLLAGEILKAMLARPCRLPSRATSVARQGVDIQLIDPETMFEGGRTGIPEVDLWLTAVNPHRLVAPPVVLSPDVDPGFLLGGYRR